jgi:serine/threonine protein kinase
MSPEQAMGGPIDHRSDLFSLGSVLYFMATGHPPFRSEGAMAVLNRICREPHRPAWQVNQEIPDELSDLIDRLLEKPPARRLASAAQVERQLAALLSQLQEFGLGRRRRGTRLPFRRIGYAVAALLIAIAVGVGAWRLVSESERNATQPSPDNPIGSVTLDHGEQFQAELHQLGEATNAAGRPASFLHQSDRQWNAEVESLRQSLSELEAQHEPYPE